MQAVIKKESPNEGTETKVTDSVTPFSSVTIKKESPNEGTETVDICGVCRN